MDKETIINSFAAIHETELKEEDYLLTYDTGMGFEPGGSKKMEELILQHVGTSGSAIGSGKYAGHGFNLRNYLFKEECEWVIKKHIDWNKNLSHIAIPVRKSAIVFPDDEEKIAYRMLLQKIARTTATSSLEDIKIHVGYLLDQYGVEK